MTRPSALYPDAPSRPRPRGWNIALLVGIVVVAAVALPPLFALLEPPPRMVDAISFENPTRYDLTIESTGADRRGWAPVGTARRGQRTTVEGVIDQGRVWIFRFSAQGEDGGELRVERAQLVRDGWVVRIPEGIGEQLGARGAPVAP